MPTIREAQLDRLISRDQDFHGRRIKNASPSVDPKDYIIQEELTFTASVISQEINNLHNRIDGLELGTNGSGGTPIGPGAVVFQKQIITANTIVTTEADASVDGAFLIVALIMGDPPGKTINWNPLMFANGPINLDIFVIGKVLITTFVSVNNLWYMTGLPST